MQKRVSSKPVVAGHIPIHIKPKGDPMSRMQIETSEGAFSSILERQRKLHGRARAKQWANQHLPESPPYIIVGNPVNNSVALRRETWGSMREITCQKGDTFLWYESAVRDPENGDHQGGGRGLFAIGEFTSECYESRAKWWTDAVYPYRIGIRIVRVFEKNLPTADLKEVLAPDAGANWRFIRRDRTLSEEEWSALQPIVQKALAAQTKN